MNGPGRPVFNDGMQPHDQEATEEDKAILEQQQHHQHQMIALEEKCNQQQRRINAMQFARDAREELFGRQEQDNSISQEFNSVFSGIKVWCNGFPQDSSRPIDFEGIPVECRNMIRRVIPALPDQQSIQTLLPFEDLKRRRKFMRGWIAFNVSELIFRSADGLPSAADIWIPEGCRNSLKTLGSCFSESGTFDCHNTKASWILKF